MRGGSRAESVGNVHAMALCQQALGSVHFLVGRWPESHDELGRSVRLARSVGAAPGTVSDGVPVPVLNVAGLTSRRRLPAPPP